MNVSSRSKRGSRLLRTLTLPGVGVLCLCAMLAAQKNPVQPQPAADKLPAPGTGSPKFAQQATKPEGVMPTVPAGFTVSIYADNIQAPRIMAYAPNGDLFVAQTGANSITVLRDANNDGVPEVRNVYAQGAAAAGRGGAGGGGGGGGRGGGAPGAAPGGAPGAGRGGAPGAAPGGAPGVAGGAPGAGRGAAGGGAPGGAPGGGGRGAAVVGAAAPPCTPPSDPNPSTGALR